MNNTTSLLLCSISAETPSTVSEVWDKMGIDRPATMTEVSATLRMIDTFEEQGLVTIWRASNRRVTAIQLTELGAERAHEALTP